MMERPIEHVEVQGLRIGFERAGSGPPLVLVHGAVSDSRVWRRQVDALSDEFTVVAWDAPGCGSSADPPESFRLAEYADALAAFVRTLALGRPYVLGHSFGGALILELYRRHGASPRALILVGAYAGWAASLPRTEVDRRLRFALEAADSLSRRVPAQSDAGPIFAGDAAGNGRGARRDHVRDSPGGDAHAWRSGLLRRTSVMCCPSSTCRRWSSTGTPTRDPP